jgi:hypothetical protein
LAEVRHVKAALGDYAFDAEFTDFVPTSVLYDAYKRYAARLNASERESSSVLNPTQFGVAIRLAFSIDPDRSCRRHYNGRKMMGYCNVRGPGSVVTYERSGNPNFRSKRTGHSKSPHK